MGVGEECGYDGDVGGWERDAGVCVEPLVCAPCREVA